jgi:MFS superfamily sulfate permease-like transporter
MKGVAAMRSGLPPQAGLYTLLASLVLYAIFGTSKQLVVAGTSASAVLVYSAVSALHPNGAAAYGSLAAGLIILTGILFLCSGLFRLGFVTQFLSRLDVVRRRRRRTRTAVHVRPGAPGAWRPGRAGRGHRG